MRVITNALYENTDDLGNQTIGDGPDTVETKNFNIALQDVIEGIYDATMKAQTNVQLNNLNHLFWMFPKDDNGVHKPRTVKLFIDESGERDVPIFSLLNHKNLSIHELRVKTTLQMNMRQKPMVKDTEQVNEVKNKKYNVSVKSCTNTDTGTSIEILMRIEEPPDTYGRILDKLNKDI
jgi:Protein of unknown function (DUF2589)